MMSKYYFNFNTSYNQFYLEDKEIKSLDSEDLWSGEAFNSRLAMHNGIIAIGTYCYGNVKGEIEILDAPFDILKSYRRGRN
ncbi:hypothetical protein AAEO56_01295 [Flavobacterium sp. DGU11]|uniref:Uncharacterized protein n=1 Tax=Flavobacterium arundinis TaxID=3139143 RepID=A0ABU9HRT4_9FLAO